MSRKHFNALALALASVRPGPFAGDSGPWVDAVDAVASACQDSNPRFDRAKFIEACRTWKPVIRDGKLTKAVA